MISNPTGNYSAPAFVLTKLGFNTAKRDNALPGNYLGALKNSCFQSRAKMSKHARTQADGGILGC